MSEYISLEQLKSPKLRERDVDVPELGGKVRIRSCSVLERVQFEKWSAGKSIEEIIQRAVVLAIVTPAGLTEDDVKSIAEQDAMPIKRIFEAIGNLWSLSEKDVAALEKNSEATANSNG